MGATNQELIERLQQLIPELDVDSGMTYCDRNADLYVSILQMFVQEDLCETLQNSYRDSTWEQYHISVHRLKNNAKTVGLLQLSDMAFQLEQACKKEDVEFIHNTHSSFIENYQLILDNMKDVL